MGCRSRPARGCSRRSATWPKRSAHIRATMSTGLNAPCFIPALAAQLGCRRGWRVAGQAPQQRPRGEDPPGIWRRLHARGQGCALRTTRTSSWQFRLWPNGRPAEPYIFASPRLGERPQLRISGIACLYDCPLAWAVTARRIRGAAARVRPALGPRVLPAGLRPQRCGCLT